MYHTYENQSQKARSLQCCPSLSVTMSGAIAALYIYDEHKYVLLPLESFQTTESDMT